MQQYYYNCEQLQLDPLVKMIRRPFAKSRLSSKSAGLIFLVGCVGFNQESSALNIAELVGSNGFVIENTDAINNTFNIPETRINDVNGDDVDDIVIKKEDAQTHIIFGSVENTFPANLNPTSLNGQNGFTVVGNFSGSADINDDGISDLIFTGAGFPQGESFVLFGKDTAINGDFLPSLSAANADGSNGFRLSDPFNAGSLKLGSQGDLSGDGIDDIVVQERASEYINYKSYDRSSVYVVFGRSIQTFPADISLSQLNGDDGFSIQNAFEDVSEYSFVSESTTLGFNTKIDFNGDEINDLYFTKRRRFEYNSAHEVNVAFVSELSSNGSFPAVVDGLADVSSFSISDGSRFNFGQNGDIGDINGDGVAELGIATEQYDGGNVATIAFGAGSNSVLQPGDNRLQFEDYSGADSLNNETSPSALGDVNGDGIDDLQLINIQADTYILFGKDTANAGDLPDNIGPDYFDGVNGFVIRDNEGKNREILNQAGDINDDDINDIVVSGQFYNSATASNETRVYVVYGRNTPFPEVLFLDDINDSTGLVIDGIPTSRFGNERSISTADVNADSADDLIIGSNEDAYVVFGTPIQQLSPRLACLGDINNNGLQDFAVLKTDANTGDLNAVVKDINGNPINTLAFDNSIKPADMEVLADINNNRSPDLVVIDKTSAKSEVRDSISDELLNVIRFNAQGGALDIESFSDQNGNGVQEIASLNDQGKVNVKDALNSQTISQLNFFSANFIPEDLSVLDTIPTQMAVLYENKDPLKLDKVTIKDMSTGRTLKNLWYGRDWDALQLELLYDINGNGSQEAAVLRTKNDRVNVLIRDSQTGAIVGNQGHSTGFHPVGMAVVPDLNNNGSEEIVVLGRQLQNAKVKATVKDSFNNNLIRSVFFNKNINPLDFSICPDMNGNGKPEIVVLGERDDNGELQLIIKDAKTGQLLGKVFY